MERHGCYLRSNVPRRSHLGGFPTAGHDCYLRYNVPHWSHLGAVSGCAELLPAWQIMYRRQKKTHKFLDVSVDFSRIKLTSCFLSVLIKMLNERGNLCFHFVPTELSLIKYLTGAHRHQSSKLNTSV